LNSTSASPSEPGARGPTARWRLGHGGGRACPGGRSPRSWKPPTTSGENSSILASVSRWTPSRARCPIYLDRLPRHCDGAVRVGHDRDHRSPDVLSPPDAPLGSRARVALFCAEAVAQSRHTETNCEPVTIASGPRPRAWPTLALTLHICQVNRQSSASTVRVTVCCPQSRSFVRRLPRNAGGPSPCGRSRVARVGRPVRP